MTSSSNLLWESASLRFVDEFRCRSHELLYHYSFMSTSDQPNVREKGSQAIFGKQNINTYGISFVFTQGTN